MDAAAVVTLTATAVVAAATVIYAGLTYKLLGATQQSAQAAREAAEAAALSVKLTNASTVVNFEVEFVWQPPLMFITITPRGANVDVLSVMGSFGRTAADGERHSTREDIFEAREGQNHVIAAGARMQYTWDSPTVHPERDDRGHTACVLISYRLAEGAPERTAWEGGDMYLPRGWMPVPMPPGQTSHVLN